MRKLFKTNLISSIFLVISFILIVLSFFFSNNNSYQYQIIFLVVILYLASSIAHHHFDKSLTLEVILEYILIGALAFLIVFGLAI